MVYWHGHTGAALCCTGMGFESWQFRSTFAAFTPQSVMKYSQQIGIVAALALVAVCYMPWAYIAVRDIAISGMHAAGTGYGKPGMLNMILALCSVCFFLLPKVWAKRANVFVAAVGIAWSVRNYLIVTACYAGDCPEKKPGIYLLLLLAVVVQVMSFFPKMDIKEKP